MATTAQDVIKKFMASLDKTTKSGTAALDEAIKACSNSKFTTIQSVIDKMVSDCKTTNNATNFLKNYCGIDLTNADTGAITGLDAGGSTAKTAESIVPESGNLINFTGNSFTTNGITFKLAKFDSYYTPTAINYSTLNDNQKFIWQSLYTWWAKESLNLISNSYGSNFGFDTYSSATAKTINFGFFTENSSIGAWTVPYSSDGGKTAVNLGMAVNLTNYIGLNTSKNSNGLSTKYGYSDMYLDRTLAHEFTHAVMMANINYFNDLPHVILEGIAELTHGADDERKYELQGLAGNYSSLKSALKLTGDDYYGYAGGYMLMRYIAKQFADSTETETVSGPFTEGADNYTNNTANTILSALGGNDTILNYATKVTINGNAGNDVIKSYSGSGNYAVINGNEGNDSIIGWSSYTTINGGDGSDTIYGAGNYGKNYGGAGNDSIYVYSSYSEAEGGAGDDSLYASGSSITLSGGDGNDRLHSYGSNNNHSDVTKHLLNGGAGNDTMSTNASSNTLKGGSDDDSITNVGGTSNLLMGEAGNDTIENSGSQNTLSGGVGNDLISLGSSSANNLIQYANGDGNDTVYGFKASDTLNVTGAKYSTVKSGNDLVVKVGSGSVLLKNASTLSANIKGTLDSGSSSIFTEGADYYQNETPNTILSALGGNDTIKNSASNVQIYGNAGNDSIKNLSTYVTMDGGAGNDSLENWDGSNSYVTIYGGAGNDFVRNGGSRVFISLDDGADYAYSWANYTTILAGAGNDSVDMVGKYSTVDGGTGSDSIYAQGSNVSVSGGTDDDLIYSYEKDNFLSGGDGNDSLSTNASNNTLKGGAGNDSILYSGGSDNLLMGEAGNDTINSSGKNHTIIGGVGNDVVSLHSSYAANNIIKYASGDGNDTVYGFKTGDTLEVTGAKYSTVTSGNDLIVKVGSGSVLLKDAATLSSVKINGTLDSGSSSIFTEGADKYSNKTANTVLSALGGNDSVENTSAAQNVTIFGNDGNDTIKNSASNVKVYGNAGDDSLDNANGAGNVMGGNNVTVDGGEGKDAIFNNGSNVLLNGGEGNDNIQNLVTYVSGVAKYADKVTIDGGKGDDFISINEYSTNSVIKYADGDGDDRVFGFDSNDTLNITSGKISKTSVSGSDFIIYVGDGSINLKGAVGSTVKVKLADGTLTTLKASAGETSAWKISGTTATYGTTDKTLITVSGVNSKAAASNFTLSGTTVTVSKNALTTTGKVKISDGYTLALGSDVTKSKTTAAAWTVSKGTANYKSASNTAGYSLASDKKSISYNKATSSSVLAKITGLSTSATASDLSVSDKTVTLSKNALGTSKVLITGGYTLALGSDVSKPKSTGNSWTINKTTATYKSAGTSAGYTLAKNKKSVTYSAAKEGSTLTQITGLKSGVTSSDLSVKDKTVTLSKNALDTSKVSITGGYTLALGSDVSTSKTSAAGWTVSKGTANYKTASTSAGYTLASNKKSVTYSAASGGKTLATITGLSDKATADDLKLSGKTVTISANALGTSKVEISDGYTLALADDVSTPTKDDAVWGVKGTTATYSAGGTSAGYTLSTDKTSITYSKAQAGSTQITLKGLKSGLTASNGAISGITVKNKTVTLASEVLGKSGASVKGAGYTYALSGAGKLTNIGTAAVLTGSKKNDTLTGGKGADSLNGGAGKDILSGGKGNDILNGDAGNDSLNGGAGKDILNGGAGNDILLGGAGNDTLNGDAGNDSLNGGAAKDILNGGAGNDTLLGGSGNDTLTGGAGNDVFVYAKGGGKDVITDYTATDKIKITSGKISKTSYSGDDVIFKIGSGTLTVQNGNGKKITIEDANGKTTIKTYYVAGLFAEDNFVTADNLSEIVAEKFVGEIEFTSSEKISQENLITYSK